MAVAEIAPLWPDCYTSADWLASEQARVFESHWHFAGFRGEFAKPGDYITLRVGRAAVIVRRTTNGLVAFRNVCSHRHAQILYEPAGSGPLRCHYHGWTYDDEGYPIGLPGCRDDFGLTESDRQTLSLERFAVETIGPFVFVHVGNVTESLSEYLGEFSSIVDGWGATFSLPFENAESHWAANWKAGVENTLEPYHAPFIHSESLAQVLEPEYEFGYAGKHSSIFHRLRPAGLRWWKEISKQAALTTSPDHSDYWHYFIYPNICIGLTHGALLSVQTFEPITSDSCTLRYRLLLPKTDDNEYPMRETLQTYLSEFNQAVLREDQTPVEACQRGYRQTQRPALLARSESRVVAFQRAIFTDVRASQAQC